MEQPCNMFQATVYGITDDQAKFVSSTFSTEVTLGKALISSCCTFQHVIRWGLDSQLSVSVKDSNNSIQSVVQGQHHNLLLCRRLKAECLMDCRLQVLPA